MVTGLREIEAVADQRLIRQVRVKYKGSPDWNWINDEDYLNYEYNRKLAGHAVPVVTASFSAGVDHNVALPPEPLVADTHTPVVTSKPLKRAGKRTLPPMNAPIPVANESPISASTTDSPAATTGTPLQPANDISTNQLPTSSNGDEPPRTSNKNARISGSPAFPKIAIFDAGVRDDTPGQYEVECVLGASKIGRKIHYLIKWKGFDKPEDNTWEESAGVSGARQLVNMFYAKHGKITAETPKILTEEGKEWEAAMLRLKK